MKKMSTLLTVVIAGCLFLCAGILVAADVPDEVVIENTYPKDIKGPVKLSHKKHSTDYKAACTDCHHVIKDGKNVWKEGDKVQKCNECHDPVKQEGKLLKLQNAYHKNCKDCHKELSEAGKPAGPFKKCNDCHEKKS